MNKSEHPARARSKDVGDEKNRDVLEKRLADKEASITERIDELEDEIVSTPAAVKAAIRDHPLMGVAGAVAAGLAVGFLVTRRRKPEVAPFHQQLVEAYIDAVGRDVRHRMRRGRSIEEAVQEALADRAPFIVYTPVRETSKESRSFLAQLGDIALKTALGFAVKTAIDLFTARLDVEELQQMLAMEQDADVAGGGSTASHAGDGAVDHPAEAP